MKAAIKVIPIILIIAAFTAILCINALSYDVNIIRVTSVLIRQYQLDTSNYTWVTPNYSYNNSIITIQPVITGVNAITATFNFDAIDIDYINVKFKVKYTGDYNITATNEFNRLYYNSWVYIGELSYNQNSNIITYSYSSDVSLYDVSKLVFQISTNYLNGTIEIYDIDIVVDDYQVMIYDDVNIIKDDIEDIKDDVSDIKDAIVGDETIPIDNSGEDNLLDKLDEETGVINDMIDEFRAFDISRYTGGIYAIMYMSTPWTNQEWYKAVMVVLLTLFALITVVRGLRR